MKNVTVKELTVLNAFYQTSEDCCGGCSPEENMSYNNAEDLVEMTGYSLRSICGLMGSLEGKGLIIDMEESARGHKCNDYVIDDEGIEIVEAHKSDSELAGELSTAEPDPIKPPAFKMAEALPTKGVQVSFDGGPFQLFYKTKVPMYKAAVRVDVIGELSKTQSNWLAPHKAKLVMAK